MSSGLPALADSPPEVYVVQPGDTLTGIAQMAGISVERLVELNGLTSPDTIFAGDTLVLAEPTPARAVYRVQPGDSLSSISRQFGVDVATIAAANGIDDPNAISVGAELVIPNPAPGPAASAPAPTPTAVPSPRPPAGPTTAPRPPGSLSATPVVPASAPPGSASGQTTYVVQRGDTLYSIARTFGVTPAAVQAANGLASPDHIFVGQRLVIPRGGTPAPGRSSPQPAAPASPASTDVVATARQYLGAPYLFGGTTPAGFDCSGFIFYVFTRAGRALPRDIWSQFDSGIHIPREQLQPGDLMFFQNTYMEGLSHNGIYVGNGEFINAVDEDSGVALSRLSSPYWADRWYGATRPRAR